MGQSIQTGLTQSQVLNSAGIVSGQNTKTAVYDNDGSTHTVYTCPAGKKAFLYGMYHQSVAATGATTFFEDDGSTSLGNIRSVANTTTPLIFAQPIYTMTAGETIKAAGTAGTKLGLYIIEETV